MSSPPPPPSPSGPGGAGPPRGPTSSVRRQWELHRAGAPGGLASSPAVDAARRGLRARNALTALGIGAVVVGIYAYTIHSISQERFLDELERDAEVMQARRAKASAE
ncbi:Hypothetical predicted protein [Podarcis lilfordi]|uniref:Cytochrome c oxidase assembly factor 3 n=1 Tax=Podarcis lilfordi TaxID=74358 RepID=A0AA35L4N1_9SAUR|nr:Hypothetical predicted protein [Podarcis lilfordi]